MKHVGNKVEKVTISSNFQVVIPKEIRDRLKLVVGQRLVVIQIGQTIIMQPVKDANSMKGFLKGMDTTIQREK